MSITIALAGNPNSGKTTLFNALTGSNQFVGNWPGVTVEEKHGYLKGNKEVVIRDLPGIYSLSPYTLEEVVARNYLISERPDAILDIVDGTNLERNLYLTTQLLELGIPVVLAVNMSDLVEKTGDEIHLKQLGKALGCEAVAVSALKGTGVQEVMDRTLAAARSGKIPPAPPFEARLEQAVKAVSGKLGSEIPEKQKRFFAIKLLENDSRIAEQMQTVPDVSEEREALEEAFDDDAESIVTNARYEFIASIIHSCLTKKKEKALTVSDRIDRIVTNRFLALPIFAVVMFVVYFVSVTTVGSIATDWANDGVFGDGWHFAFIGASDYEEAAEEYGDAADIIGGFIDAAAEAGEDTDELEALLDSEEEDFDADAAGAALAAFAAGIPETDGITFFVEDEETLETEEITATGADLAEALEVAASYEYEEPDPADFGLWIPGIPVLLERLLDSVHCAGWLESLILDGILAGVGAVLGFVPQMLVLFLFLAFLESCGYMARVAFIMDRIFRRFGLSGKSFIPLLIGSGCGVPGIMATRTIENEKDRRMTIMTVTFIPCGAKLPFIAMMAGAIFGGAPWVAPLAYFLGIAAVICTGVILKKTRLFAGDPAPFVMELPAYHMPTVGNVLRSMWERAWSFIKKAGTIILLSTIVIWFTSYFGFVDGAFRMLEEEELDHSILAAIGNAIAWIFAPLGWGNWQAAVAAITGLVAKENIVGTMGILYSAGAGTVYQNMAAVFTTAAGFSFLIFNLLCAPCFAAMGAIRREMNSTRWFFIAIGYQCVFAYLAALVAYALVGLATGAGFSLVTAAAFLVILLFLYLLFRPAKREASRLQGEPQM